MNQTWTIILTAGGPTASAIIAAIFAWHASHKTAIAQQISAKAAKETAEGAIQDTFTKAYAAADKHWAVYNEAMQKWNVELQEQVNENARRIEDAELRAEADKVARTKAEHLYSMSIIYLRRVIRWIEQNLPGEHYPPPPSELNLDL